MKKYEIIDHTADIGIRAYGKELKELFSNAALGMFELIVDLKDVSSDESRTIKLKASNQEELLVSWLRELLYRYTADEILFKKFEIDNLGQKEIDAKAYGERIDLKKHSLKMEIKAVTYHELKIEKVDSIWSAQVIFDV